MLPYSSILVDYLDDAEALKLLAYKVEGEKFYSIGYGHTGPDVHAGMTCTPAQAAVWRDGNLHSAWLTVDYHVNVPLSQGQVNALTDFVYNAGPVEFENSTFLKDLNKGNYSAVPEGLRLYNKGGDPLRVMGGLLKRRNVEASWWNS
jgi:lysozyme